MDEIAFVIRHVRNEDVKNNRVGRQIKAFEGFTIGRYFFRRQFVLETEALAGHKATCAQRK